MGTWLWPESKVVAVIDGDTFDALVKRDLGFGGVATYPIRLRLNRINTPKVSSSNGKLARERATALLTASPAIHLETIKPYKFGGPADQRGEYMAEVTLPDGGNLSDLLVAEGLAVYWDGNGPRPADS